MQRTRPVAWAIRLPPRPSRAAAAIVGYGPTIARRILSATFNALLELALAKDSREGAERAA